MVSVTPGIASAKLGGEAVVLNPNAGQYFGLNEVAARIFDIVQEPKSFQEIEDILIREYDVERDQLRGDVAHFVEALVEQGLVCVSE